MRADALIGPYIKWETKFLVGTVPRAVRKSGRLPKMGAVPIYPIYPTMTAFLNMSLCVADCPPKSGVYFNVFDLT